MSRLASAPFLAWAVSSISQHSGEAQNKCPPASIILVAKSASVAWAMCKPFCFPSAHRCACVWKTDFSASTPVKKKETISPARMGFCQQLNHRYTAPCILAGSCGLSSLGPAQAPPTDNLEACNSAVCVPSTASSSTNKSREQRPKSETCFLQTTQKRQATL